MTIFLRSKNLKNHDIVKISTPINFTDHMTAKKGCLFLRFYGKYNINYSYINVLINNYFLLNCSINDKCPINDEIVPVKNARLMTKSYWLKSARLMTKSCRLKKYPINDEIVPISAINLH